MRDVRGEHTGHVLWDETHLLPMVALAQPILAYDIDVRPA